MSSKGCGTLVLRGDRTLCGTANRRRERSWRDAVVRQAARRRLAACGFDVASRAWSGSASPRAVHTRGSGWGTACPSSPRRVCRRGRGRHSCRISMPPPDRGRSHPPSRGHGADERFGDIPRPGQGRPRRRRGARFRGGPPAEVADAAPATALRPERPCCARVRRCRDCPFPAASRQSGRLPFPDGCSSRSTWVVGSAAARLYEGGGVAKALCQRSLIGHVPLLIAAGGVRAIPEWLSDSQRKSGVWRSDELIAARAVGAV